MHRAWVPKLASRYCRWQVRVKCHTCAPANAAVALLPHARPLSQEHRPPDTRALYAGWPAPAGVDAGAAQMQALMQIIGNATPQAAMEIQRQLTAGAGPFTLQGMQVSALLAHG